MTFVHMLSFALLPVHGHAYSTPTDSFDMCRAVQDINTLRSMAYCFLCYNDDLCTPIASIFKSYLPKLVPTGCANCDQVQKVQVCCFLEAIMVKELVLFEQLKKNTTP